MNALGFTLSEVQGAQLDDASKLDVIHPYMFFGEFTSMLSGGTALRGFR